MPQNKEADAELWWEWNQRHLPLKTARFLDRFFGIFGGNRFHTGQPIIGGLLALFYIAVLILANTTYKGIIFAALPVYAYEWFTLKDRTRKYNRRLWMELVAKWNPETQLTQPVGT